MIAARIPIDIVIAVSLALVAGASAASHPLRLSGVERRHDVIALVASARTGRILGGVRVSEARTTSFHPASVFKLAIAFAALDGHAQRIERHDCHGRDTLDGHAYRCWLDAGHGSLGLTDAIAHSCNLYFRRLAEGMARSTLVSRAHAFGLLPDALAFDITDDLLLGEAAGVTPEDMMRTALTIASRGRLGRPVQQLSGARYEPIYRGLRECVRSGTARSAWTRKTSLAGKTGTAQRPGSQRRHVGWFIGYCPERRPDYAIVVLHRSGMGSDAAAVAREIIETLY